MMKFLRRDFYLLLAQPIQGLMAIYLQILFMILALSLFPNRPDILMLWLVIIPIFQSFLLSANIFGDDEKFGFIDQLRLRHDLLDGYVLSKFIVTLLIFSIALALGIGLLFLVGQPIAAASLGILFGWLIFLSGLTCLMSCFQTGSGYNFHSLSLFPLILAPLWLVANILLNQDFAALSFGLGYLLIITPICLKFSCLLLKKKY